jgi:hypothetical protein
MQKPMRHIDSFFPALRAQGEAIRNAFAFAQWGKQACVNSPVHSGVVTTT